MLCWNCFLLIQFYFASLSLVLLTGHVVDLQALFYAALRCSPEMLTVNEGSKNLVRAINNRLSALSFHIREYYWVDMKKKIIFGVIELEVVSGWKNTSYFHFDCPLNLVRYVSSYHILTVVSFSFRANMLFLHLNCKMIVPGMGIMETWCNIRISGSNFNWFMF